MNLQIILKEIKKKGLDPYNLEVIFEEIKSQGAKISREEIENHLSSNQVFNYNSTQNDIAWLMSQIGKHYKPKRLADISCGLGNILIHCDYCETVGYDINKNVIDIANFISPEIDFTSRNSLEISNKEKYDAIISHFPYGRMQLNGRKDYFETAFISKSLSILREKGVLICLVPDRFLYGSQRDFQLANENIFFIEIFKNFLFLIKF